MRGWLWLVILTAGVLGCGKRAMVFRTPYDEILKKELRRRGSGWVSAGTPSAEVAAGGGYIMPGQFLRVVMELPQPLSEEASSWNILRVDTLRVYEDSLVFTPWGGALRVGGLPLDSVRSRLQAAASRIFIGVRIYVYPLYPYYLYGRVQQQGRVFFDRSRIPLYEILSFMQLQNREADLSRIKILRGAPHYKEVLLVDARDAATATHEFLLHADDIILVESRSIVRARTEYQNLLFLLSALQFLNLVLLVYQISQLF